MKRRPAGMLFAALIATQLLTPITDASAQATAPDSTQHQRIAGSKKKEGTGQWIARVPVRIVLIPLKIVNWGLYKGDYYVQEDNLVAKSQSFTVSLRNRGLAFIFGGAGNGSGIGAGVLWTPYDSWVRSEIGVAASFKGYWNNFLSLDFTNGVNGTFRPIAWLRFQKRTQDDFYGLGMSSQLGDRTDYGFEQTIGTFEASKTLLDKLTPRIEFGYSNNTLFEGQNSSLPSIQYEFTPAEVPGLGPGTQIASATFALTFDTRDTDGNSSTGIFLAARGGLFEDTKGNTYDFYNYGFTAAGFLPIFKGPAWWGPRSVLAARALIDVNQGRNGGEVPFYLMPFIGAEQTPRGFRNFRFRDGGRVLLNLEYRWRIQSFLQAVLFLDEGQVFTKASDFRGDLFAASWGIGLRAITPQAVLMRFEVGKGREGTRIFASFGVVF